MLHLCKCFITIQRHSLNTCLRLLGLVSPGFVGDHYPSISLVFTVRTNLYKTLQANVKDYCSLRRKAILTYCSSGIISKLLLSSVTSVSSDPQRKYCL